MGFSVGGDGADGVEGRVGTATAVIINEGSGLFPYLVLPRTRSVRLRSSVSVSVF
ncbi:MAG: hypothetical protein RLZZ344_1385 [Pseudomonadota bacterium]